MVLEAARRSPMALFQMAFASAQGTVKPERIAGKPPKEKTAHLSCLFTFVLGNTRAR
jgi:hypothetical protein